jgi:YjbE family integral membrane protein
MNADQTGLIVALLEIIWIDLLLSGDNAIVIALACRSLPEHQRMRGILLGSGAAVALRIIFTFVLVAVLTVPFVKLAGGLLLIWIAVRLAVEGEGRQDIKPAKSIWAAVRTIVIADALMSLDNVVAITAAAKGELALIIFGTLLAVPLILFGSSLLVNLFSRYPILIWAGSALLGFVGGELAADEPFIAHLPLAQAGAFVAAHFAILCGLAGALFVLGTAALLRRKKTNRASPH